MNNVSGTKNFYDVIIVGAGPAGLNCAQALANSNLKVLVVEKNKEIGPKICAGGLTGKDLAYLNLPEELIDFKYKEIALHVNRTKSIITNDDYFAYTINRKKLGQWQLAKLKSFSNIIVKTEALVSQIEKEYLVINGEKVFYKILVGADGSASLVRKFLNLKSEDLGIAIQYLLPNTKYRDFEVFFKDQFFSAWYAWIFPHQDFVSIGCGAKPQVLSSDKLQRNFQLWLKENNIDVSSAQYQAFPINCDYQGHKFENIYLIGDAAGLASIFTGEGIYQALVSGEEVGRMILDEKYKAQKINNLLSIKRKHKKILFLLIKAGRFKTVLFYLGQFLFKNNWFKKKVIEILG
ncbi:MAG: NAD(P)/FAD-dependent oxidoreductase [Planctomycetes bacterium]|jgi:geranylgeranyl reductase|nr:NAD(P)/FAD-dependent oxidoreductase [Planctomycetota bacterium]